MSRFTLRAALICGALVPTAARAGDNAFGAPELLPLPAVSSPSAIRAPRYTPAVAPVVYPRMAAAGSPTSAPRYAQYQSQPPAVAYHSPYMTPQAPGTSWSDGGPTLADQGGVGPVHPGQPLPPTPPTPPMGVSESVPSDGRISGGNPSLEDHAFDSSCTACDGDYGCDEAWGPSCTPWFGAIGGLIMSRDRPNETRLTCACAGLVNAMDATSADPSDDWTGGYDLRFGRRVGDFHAWEVNYWRVGDSSQSFSVRDTTDMLDSALNFGTINAGGTDMRTIFNGSREQRIYRDNRFQNLEINLLRSPMAWSWCESIQVGALFGVRWFRFDESLLYSASGNGFEFGSDPLSEGYYNIDVKNNLVGPQIGATALWQWNPCFSLYATPKVGLYGNAIEANQYVYRGDGAYAIFCEHYKADISVMSQFDMGMNWRFGCNWSAYLGYRLVAASGIALADNQIPQSLNDGEQIETVDSNGSLLLHGVFGGVGYNY